MTRCHGPRKSVKGRHFHRVLPPSALTLGSPGKRTEFGVAARLRTQHDDSSNGRGWHSIAAHGAGGDRAEMRTGWTCDDGRSEEIPARARRPPGGRRRGSPNSEGVDGNTSPKGARSAGPLRPRRGTRSARLSSAGGLYSGQATDSRMITRGWWGVTALMPQETEELRASVGSTEAAKHVVARVGVIDRSVGWSPCALRCVVGPTRAK
jgi:hypothetical protein